VRGFTRVESRGVGNFWVDLFRSTFYVLLPAATIFTIFLVGQGCVQSFSAGFHAHFPGASEQFIPLGPVASQVAIKQLGTNGGGFFNANGAHPFENPTPLSNLSQVLAILVLPAGLTVAFGRLYAKGVAGNGGVTPSAARREGLVYLVVMLALLVPALALTTWAESHPSGAMQAAGILGRTSKGRKSASARSTVRSGRRRRPPPPMAR
jgi:K+-transporting ATPase ATPase A chain